MIIYHSSLSKEAAIRYKQVKPNEKLHALVSYGRRNNDARYFLVTDPNLLDGLIMDSGTWTRNQNYTKLKDIITRKGCAAYAKNFEDKVNFYFNFDEDFKKAGFETNYSNQLKMERAGLKPVPVVHDCYSDEIQQYIDRGYKLIAIGSGELKHASLDDLNMIVQKPYRAGVKIHFLGCTSFDKLTYIPVYSCDASTWGHQSARGFVFYWNPLKTGYKKIEKVSFYGKPPKRLIKTTIDNFSFKKQFAAHLKSELNFTIDDLRGKEGLANREVANLHFFAELEKEINKKHKEQGFKF
jgi:hypothetical protein